MASGRGRMDRGMWHAAVALTAVAVAAGCAEPAAVSHSGTDSPAVGETMSIAGLVQGPSFDPVVGAQVSIRFAELSTVTDVSGRFRFEDLVASAYVVDVVANGFENATLTAGPGGNASLDFILEIAQALRPTHVTVQFHGSLECALEVLIITPSCDSALTHPMVGGPAVFQSLSNFEQGVNKNWRTVVVDVDFDPDANPGVAGMRVTVRGRNDENSLGTYEKFGQFYGADPFTFRLEPGQDYGSAPEDVPVPVNATVFRLEAFPQSHAWHPGGAGVLGVGFAKDMTFDLFVTVFYNEPAPADWTFFDNQPA